MSAEDTSKAITTHIPLILSTCGLLLSMYCASKASAVFESIRQKDSKPITPPAFNVTTIAKLSKKKLNDIKKDAIPEELKPSYYFKMRKDFQHQKLLDQSAHVWDIVGNIHSYMIQWFNKYQPQSEAVRTEIKGIGDGSFTMFKVDRDTFIADTVQYFHFGLLPSSIFVEDNVRIMGGVLDVTDGSIYIGKNVTIEPNVYLKGPLIIGQDCVIRHGAYLRGDVILGKNVFIRSEVKNALIMDCAELCHPGYCGDSVCGYKSHFGNQVTTANLSLLSSNRSNISVTIGNTVYDTGHRKLGIILGDSSQLGCSVVTDPGTLIGMNTIVYSLTRLNKGIYGPNELIKNKPMEHGVIERTQLHSN